MLRDVGGESMTMATGKVRTIDSFDVITEKLKKQCADLLEKGI
jgi:hypothetical protein